MFILVLLGQFLRLIWGIGLAISPPRFIKLTHSRMRVGYLEWPGWVGGLVYLCARCVCGRSCLFVCQGGVLFICVWRASACSPSRELCCLDGETGHRACTKNPFWYCHWYIQELRPNAEKLFPLKSCRLLLRLKCIISHVVGVFHVVYWRGGGGGSCLFVYGGLQPAVLVESSAALMGRLDTELALKIHSGIATDIYRNCGPMLKSRFL